MQGGNVTPVTFSATRRIRMAAEKIIEFTHLTFMALHPVPKVNSAAGIVPTGEREVNPIQIRLRFIHLIESHGHKSHKTRKCCTGLLPQNALRQLHFFEFFRNMSQFIVPDFVPDDAGQFVDALRLIEQGIRDINLPAERKCIDHLRIHYVNIVANLTRFSPQFQQFAHQPVQQWQFWMTCDHGKFAFDFLATIVSVFVLPFVGYIPARNVDDFLFNSANRIEQGIACGRLLALHAFQIVGCGVTKQGRCNIVLGFDAFSSIAVFAGRCKKEHPSKQEFGNVPPIREYHCLNHPSIVMKRSVNILTFYQNGENLLTVTVPIGEERLITVGTQKDKVDVAFKSDLISRIHAQLILDEKGNCLLIDQGSTNGTFVHGIRIPAHQPTALQWRDEVSFGGSNVGRMVFGESVPAKQQASPSPRAEANVSSQIGKSLLALLQSKPEISIGRSSECDVVIDSSLVSRLHAKLRKLPDGKVMLIDLGSTNGTFLNGQRVHGTAQVQPGDTVIVGRNVLSLDHGPKTLTGEIAIRTEAIRKQFPNGKVGLQDTTLEIPAGRLVAIMGPSGCGKSTLLKCLTGEAPATQGKVYLHNLELVQNYAFLKTLIGYVPQDDIVHKELTVEQSLYYAARLRMEKPSQQEIETKIADVLQRLRIGHIRHSPIAKISGGQRKRVSIAVELLTDPLILFLDEPTSPLDPQTIEEFLKILQELAHKGTTVVMVTHKPEDLEYMDSVIFMAEGGAMVYEGSIADYKTYFGVRTAVEVYANICGERAAGWIQKFRGKGVQPKPVTNISNPRLVKRSDKNIFVEWFWLSRRYFRIKTNDLLNIGILIGQAPIIAILVCLIFSKLTLSVPFLITLSAVWFGTSNAAREIVTEAAVYRRERMFNLRIGPYILSKLLVLAFFGLIQSVLFSVIILIGFQNLEPGWHSLGATIGWVWLLIVCATALGLMISALVNTAEKAMTIVPLVLIPQVMLAGVVAPMGNQMMEIVSYVSPTRWGNEGLTLLQERVHNGSYDGLSNEIEEEDEFAKEAIQGSMDSTITAREALEDQFHPTYEKRFGALAFTYELDLLVLCVMTGGLLAVVAVAMRRKDSI